MASYSVLPGSVGFISVLAVSNPVLRLHSGCLRTRWIELRFQRELDFTLLEEFQFGRLFGHLLDPCPLRSIAKRISGPHLGALAEPLSFPLKLSGIRKASLLALGPPLGPLFSRSWDPFAALGVSFQGHVAPICWLLTWFHCLLLVAFNHGFTLRFIVP